MNDKLIYALSNISDDLIIEANAIRENNAVVKPVKKRTKLAWLCGACAAACSVALTLGIVLPLQNNGRTNNQENQNPYRSHGLGTVLVGQHGSVKFAAVTENTATFEFDITSDLNYVINFDISFYRYALSGTPKLCVVSTDDYIDEFETIERLPIELITLTVNGENSPQYKIPDTVGHYEIVFDYSAVLKSDENLAVHRVEFTSLEELWYHFSFDLMI